VKYFFLKVNILALLIFVSVDAEQERFIALFPVSGAVESGFPDSFHIHLFDHLLGYTSLTMPIRTFNIPFDPAIREMPLRNNFLLAAAYGVLKKNGNNEFEILFRIIDFRNNALSEKTIPLRFGGLNDAALTAALQIRSLFEGSPLARVRVDSDPANLQISVDGRNEGFSPKELILNPGLHQIELSGHRIKPYSEVVHIPAGATENFYHQAEIDYYPTWIFMILALATTWESMLMYHFEKENRDKNLQRVETARSARIVLSSLSVMGWAGSTFCFVKNRKLDKKYQKN
jgi:hypothetical protein